jgi:hypothetical protein
MYVSVDDRRPASQHLVLPHVRILGLFAFNSCRPATDARTLNLSTRRKSLAMCICGLLNVSTRSVTRLAAPVQPPTLLLGCLDFLEVFYRKRYSNEI